MSDLEVGSVLRTAFNERIASPSDDVPLEGSVVGNIEVTRTIDMVFVKGQAATITRLVCGRCLDPFPQRLDVSFNEEFVLHSASAAPTRQPADADKAPETLDPTAPLDITDLIREHLLLAVPMVPLCSLTCRGLCPVCGANWNLTTCTCSQETVDPRLAPLQQFGQSVKRLRWATKPSKESR